MDTRTRAFSHFKRADPRFYAAVASHKAALPRELPSGRGAVALFASLAETIVSQQLGVAAADSIFARVKEACGGSVSPRSIGRAPARALRKAGLSGAKIKTLKALAAAVRRGAISLPALRHLAEDEATSRLTEIWGIGPWSAEMFLMFSLGRPDVFSPGDLGLARAIEAIYGLPRGAPRARLIAISERWAPYRTFASLALWRSRAAASPPRRPSRKKQGKC